MTISPYDKFQGPFSSLDPWPFCQKFRIFEFLREIVLSPNLSPAVMSFVGNSRDGAASSAASQRYFCHQCNRTVSITVSATSDLVCPICNGGFLEEFESPDPIPTLDPFFPFMETVFPSPFSGLPLVFSSSSSNVDFQHPSGFSAIFGRGFENRSNENPQDPNAFNPMLFLQNYLQNVMGGGGNVEVVFENASGSRLPANFGDYFIGSGSALEQLIQHLAENDPNRFGTPPASKTAVEALPDVQISEELLVSDYAQCAVCMENFVLGSMVKRMPCKHLYHAECILPWLELHNSCPVCRYELPTDDPDYVSAKPNLDATSSSRNMENEGNSDSPRTTERRFRISLPWPFRSNLSETNNTDVNGSNNNSRSNNDTGRNSENHETREEDLD